MVWDTTQSTLYTLGGAVERHNAGFETDFSGRGESADNEESIKAAPHAARFESNSEYQKPPCAREKHSEKSETDDTPLTKRCINPGQTDCPSPHTSQPKPMSEPVRARTERVGTCEKCEEAPKEERSAPRICEECPLRCPKCGKPLPAQKASNPLEALFSDKDTLLLAALILLLWHEKADIKLIGALAFILFSN